ncbi:MAG: hypothetical protein ACFFG0_33545 [Candidatus Thorarchaeota archaeon]
MNLHPTDIQIPEKLKLDYSLNEICLRKFGFNISDLDINFNTNSFSKIAIKILLNCLRDSKGEPISEKFIRELPISKRIEVLFKIAIVSVNYVQDYKVECKNGSCQKEIGINLLKKDFIDFINDVNNLEQISVKLFEQELLLRKPTGLDQINWSRKEYKNKEEAIIDIILTLITKKIEIKDIKVLKEIISSSKDVSLALDKLDPLINLKITIKCPHCDFTDDYFIDLNEFALFLLSNIQKDLLYSIHLLAKFYHWSEEYIISLPIWRRKYYLTLIESEERR